MLLKLRGGQSSFLVTILLGVLIASFAIFGIGPTAFSGSTQQVATVGDTEVHAQSYYRRVQNRAQALQVQFGGSMSVAEIIRLMRLDQQVLQQMIGEAAVTEHIRELGLRAGNAELRKELEGYEGFVLPDGSLSKEMVLQVLQSNNMTRAEFMSEVRESVSRRNLLQTLSADDLVSRGYAEALYTWQAERRRASMINIQAETLVGIPAPTDEELTTYYEDNKASYYSDERRSYSYILVTPEQFMDDITLDEELVTQEYASRIDEFVKPELRGLQQVGFSDKAAADAFLLALQVGTDFVEAATSVTAFSADEIELGDFSKSDLATEYDAGTADAIFDLADGGTTQPLEAFGGWNVFKVVSITEANEVNIDEVRGEIEAALKQEEAIDRMYDVVNDISDTMAEETSVSAIAEKTGLPLATVTSVNNRGITVDGTQAVTQQDEVTILRAAFQNEMDVESDIVDLDPTDSTKGLYMVELSDIVEPAERPFEDVRADIVSAVSSIKRNEKAAEIADQAKARLEAGETAEDIAADLGGTSFAAKNVARSGDANSSLSANIRRLIFDLRKDAIDFEQAADGNGYVVVQVEEITPGDPTSRPSDVDALVARVNSQMLDELYIQYQGYLLQKYEPTQNRVLINSLFADRTQ